MLKDIWQQKSDEELIHASEHLSEYTKEAEEFIRAELKIRGLPEPMPTTREEIIENKTKRNRVKGALWGVGIGASIITVINLVDAFLIENAVSRGINKKEILSGTMGLIIVVFAAILGAFVGVSEKKEQKIELEEDPVVVIEE